jgi:hypothetical protein
MKDPTREGPPSEQQLFEAMAKVASGFSTEAVLGASINMLVNAIRQVYGKRSDAEYRMRELYGKHMELLMQHYDPVTGRRRSVIPFTQVIAPKRFDIDNEFSGFDGSKKIGE